MTPDEKKNKIVEACKNNYEANKTICNYFLHAVFKEVAGATLSGNADSLVDQFASGSGGWTTVTRSEAVEAVKTGALVVAGLKAADHGDDRAHGHVAIVVDGDLYKGIYPKVWCGGGTLGRSDGTKSVGEVWGKTSRDKVKYFKYKNY